jgi:hypothetical protein
MKLLKDMLTEKNNSDYDIVRILGSIGFIIYNTIAVMRALHDCPGFNAIDYATGLSIILGVVSAGVTLKYTKEC